MFHFSAKLMVNDSDIVKAFGWMQDFWMLG